MLGANALAAEPLTPILPDETRFVTQKISYLITDRSSSEQSVWTRQDFQSAQEGFVSRGFVDEVVWFKLELANPEPETRQIFLEFPWSRWSSWELSSPHILSNEAHLGAGWKAQKLSAHRSPLLTFSIPGQGHAVWLLRVESVYGLQWGVRQLGVEKAIELRSEDRFYMGLYFGIVGFAVFFFLAVSLESRLRLAVDLVFLLLTLYLLLIPSVLTYDEGLFGFSAWLSERATFYLVLPAVVATLRLQKNLDEGRMTRLMVRLRHVLLLGMGLITVLSFVNWGPWLIKALLWNSLGIVVLIVLEALLAAWSKSWRAIFFILAWLTLGGVFILYALIIDGRYFGGRIIQSPFWLALAALGSLGFFSLAMADAYRTMQRAIVREQTQRQSWEQAMHGAHEVQETFIQGNSESELYEIRPGYHPCEATGGDWLGYRFDKQHQQLYLSVADVDGHGFSAALVAGTIHGAFYSEALLAESIDAQREGWLGKMVQHLHALVHITEHSTLRSVTLVGCCFDFRLGQLHYVNVGHVPVLLLREGKVQTLFAIGSPLGLTDEPVLGEKFVPLQAEDRLLLITDGILAERSRADTVIKLKDVAACLQAGEALAENQKRIEDLIKDIKEQKKDDCTYILIRIKKAKIFD